MDGETTLPLSHRRRSGSETRQKQRRTTIRWAEEEHTALKQAADAAGLTLASHIREVLLAAPRIPRRRRPRADVAALSRLYGELGRIGGNINQVARRINFGETPAADELREALGGLRETMASIRGAMGYEA